MFILHFLKFYERKRSMTRIFLTRTFLIGEYNIGNIFIEKLYTKCGGETIPRPYFKKIKIEHISGSIV